MAWKERSVLHPVPSLMSNKCATVCRPGQTSECINWAQLSAGNGAKLLPNKSGTQGIAEQQNMACMQTGQDTQQTNSIQNVAVLSLVGE